MKTSTKIKLIIAATKAAPIVKEAAGVAGNLIRDKVDKASESLKSVFETVDIEKENHFDTPCSLRFSVAGVSKERTKITIVTNADIKTVDINATNHEIEQTYQYVFTVPSDFEIDVQYHNGMLLFELSEPQVEPVVVKL